MSARDIRSAGKRPPPASTVSAKPAPDVYRIGRGLVDGSLPREEWTHQAHLAAAVYLLTVHRGTKASELMPTLIRRYNEAHGVANTDESGFHATITRLYLCVIGEFISSLPGRPAPGQVLAALLDTPLADREFPLYFYSRKRLMSVAARRAWVEPDILPLSWYFHSQQTA